MKWLNKLNEAPFLRAFHGWLTLVWLTQFPLVYWIMPDLQRSIPYLIFISLATALLGQMSSWQAARAEVKVDKVDTEKLETGTFKVNKRKK